MKKRINHWVIATNLVQHDGWAGWNLVIIMKFTKSGVKWWYAT